MRSAIYHQGCRFEEKRYSTEEEFETFLIRNSQLLFGKESIFIDAKKKIASKTMGGAIPDGFVFNLADLENPEFYLVEVELCKHDFFRHIFPQITKFLSFFKNPKSQSELAEKIFDIICEDKALEKEFKNRIGRKEIFKFIKDTIENSRNILLVLDEMKEELPEIMSTYTDTWDKMVRVLVLKKYESQEGHIISLTPDFASIELPETPEEAEANVSEKTGRYSEEFHLEGVNDAVKESYQSLKQEILEYENKLIFNPTKYYVSIVDHASVAYIQVRKKKLNIVIMADETKVRQIVKGCKVNSLSESVQKFWGGKCCGVDVDNKSRIGEVVDAIKQAVAARRA